MQEQKSPSASERGESAARHRSGAVARMLRMPVATLRVWERRYGLTQPALSASGQRLYSADDVRRLALLKQLTDLGHAIGSLAALDMAQCSRSPAPCRRAGRPAALEPALQPPRRRSPGAWRSSAQRWRQRLQRPALRRWLSRPLQLLGPFADAAQAAAALQGTPVDALAGA